MEIDRGELDFPPGHPVPGGLYRSHPLPSKVTHYTPIEQYDRLLYEEREAELLKLLIDLGACRIEIIETYSDNGEVEGQASAAATTVGKISAEGKATLAQVKTASRVFELDGSVNNSIDRGEYQWLDYEPSWRTLVHARLVGKCRTATVDLSQDTSFSANSSLAIADDLLGGAEDVASAGTSFRLARKTRKGYRFLVSFVNKDDESPSD